jgi:hypothetical protein
VHLHRQQLVASIHRQGRRRWGARGLPGRTTARLTLPLSPPSKCKASSRFEGGLPAAQLAGRVALKNFVLSDPQACIHSGSGEQAMGLPEMSLRQGGQAAQRVRRRRGGRGTLPQQGAEGRSGLRPVTPLAGWWAPAAGAHRDLRAAMADQLAGTEPEMAIERLPVL